MPERPGTESPRPSPHPPPPRPHPRPLPPIGAQTRPGPGAAGRAAEAHASTHHHRRPHGPAEGIRPILARALELHGIAPRLERRLPLHVWAAAVGPEIASRARPTALRAGELHILVQDHRWRDQLDAARSLIMARVNGRLGRPAVRELRFGLAHEGFLEPASDALSVARRFAQVLPEAREGAAAQLVGDAPLHPELREALVRAATASLRRGRAGA